MESNQMSGPSATAPAMVKSPEELVVFGPNGLLKVLPFSGDPVSLGRAASNTLSYPEDTGLSRQHFVIERTEEGVMVRDLGSKNGTELNAKRITTATLLQPGDRIRAGRLVVEYRTGDMRPPDKTVLF